MNLEEYFKRLQEMAARDKRRKDDNSKNSQLGER